MSSVVDTIAVIREFLIANETGDLIGTLDSGITDSGTELELSAGYTSLLPGLQVLKVGSEIVTASGLLSTLSVGELGRGTLGSSATSHVSGTEVRYATLYDILGEEVINMRPNPNFKNNSPMIIFDSVGSHRNFVVEIRSPRVQFRIMGGKDSQGTHREEFARVLYRVFSKRIQDATGVSVSSGTIVSAVEDGSGHQLWDQTVNPNWPYYLTHVNFEIRN